MQLKNNQTKHWDGCIKHPSSCLNDLNDFSNTDNLAACPINPLNLRRHLTRTHNIFSGTSSDVGYQT